MQERYGHPKKQQPGKSYTWAAGVIDDVFGFDPTAFGLSPREAQQMDPQQRILLELTWEALEDAGIPPSSLAGKDVGVFVGGSSLDYGTSRVFDLASGDQYFATGNTLSILSNRVSYIFDFKGPSFTVDTACSSSLVALNQAVEALRAGRVETAVVGGVNALVSPFPFVSFSQASMLSRTGLCQAFSAAADGYVRAEGGVVLVLQKLSQARRHRAAPRGLVVATDVNSDGRTSGIALPSGEAQAQLLERIYQRAGIDPNRLAFVEAHGTGTPVGDPIEAGAIGRALARRRNERLPIGSIKTNVGHLEPASGLAGVMKAAMALNARLLPRSLHFNEPNPNIDFGALNLKVAAEPIALTGAAQDYAGVNSFGFGGTNAHVVLGQVHSTMRSSGLREARPAAMMVLSAQSRDALTALAGSYATLFETSSAHQTEEIISAAAHHREHLNHRAAISVTTKAEVETALAALASGRDDPHLVTGTASGRDLPVAFIYSGNGSQWAGMGVHAYASNEAFRAHFDRVDGLLRPLAGWSLRELMHSDGLATSLNRTSVSQPLIFAIQSAATSVLHQYGVRPMAVIGHSVGEVAAAEAAGILDLETAVRVIYLRSRHQELVRGAGRMAAVIASVERARELCESIYGVEIAAYNSPRVVTIAGPTAAMAELAELCRQERIVFRDLNLDYPFHSALMGPVREPLLADLQDLDPAPGDRAFISTVTGALLSGESVDGAYWWRNVREPVCFSAALEYAGRIGARCFVEIGPRPTLINHVADCLDKVTPLATAAVLERSETPGDPLKRAVATVFTRGGSIDRRAAFGSDPRPDTLLPSYPWQHQTFRGEVTGEAVGSPLVSGYHPLCGARASADGLEWRAHLDPVVAPFLADHKLGERVILPGTGLLEIGLTAASQWLKTEKVCLSQFDIIQFLEFQDDETREILTRVSPGADTLEILSRPRLAGAAWSLHARGTFFHGDAIGSVALPQATRRSRGASEVYRDAALAGLNFGPGFRQLDTVSWAGDNRLLVDLTKTDRASDFTLNPVRLDCCFHGLFMLIEAMGTARGVGYVPVRFDEVTLAAAGRQPHHAMIEVKLANPRSIVADFIVFDEDRNPIASLRGARFQMVRNGQIDDLDGIGLVHRGRLMEGLSARDRGVRVLAQDLLDAAALTGLDENPEPVEDSLLLDGWATAFGHELVNALARGEGLDPEQAIAEGRVPQELRPWLFNLLLSLEASGLVRETNGRWHPVEDADLPSSRDVLAALIADYPDRASEVLLAAELNQLVKAFRVPGGAESAFAVSNAISDFHHLSGLFGRAAATTAMGILDGTPNLWPADRALRVLQLGHGPITHNLIGLVERHDGTLDILETDRRRFEHARLAVPRGSAAKVLAGVDALPATAYDLVVAAGGLHRLASATELAAIGAAVAPEALLVALEPDPSIFRDTVFGLSGDWFAAGKDDFPVGALRPAEQWARDIETAGFEDVLVKGIVCGREPATLMVARAKASFEAVDDQSRSALIISSSDTAEAELAATLAALMPARGIHVSLLLGDDAQYDVESLPETVVQLLGSGSDNAASSSDSIREQCQKLIAFAENLDGRRVSLWLVFSGALAGDISATDSAIWMFSRTLANEYPNIDIRRVDLARHVSSQRAAEEIRDLIASDTREAEFVIDETAVRMVRIESVAKAHGETDTPRAQAVRLERSASSGQRVAWVAADRPAPAADEIEIAVEATGLNFRDLMWSMSLLPDDMLEDGFAGPTMGLECAGRVARVGRGVRDFAPGDHVMTLTSAGFASHVNVPVRAVARVPNGLTSEAAATIPVAFMTAYYALVSLARVRRGEWILVHGGAGGVGLAAAQIARQRGAKVIATAGSAAKRELLTALGIAHVLDSRSTSFVGQVRQITGEGVDIVLNSLAGEAMEKGIGCLRPFGRFIELGKRDYVANTQVGLRPFRRNLSYFGVDVDQLMGRQKRVGQKLYADVMRLFDEGVFSPLPYSAFDADEVGEAFRLMQHSGHIGKVVIRPPAPASVAERPNAFCVDAERTHLITGGLGGFGLETAKWLVEKGARHLVLVGRRGAGSVETQAAVSDLAAAGASVRAIACDVTDAGEVERLFKTIRREMPPLAGVIHGAMVLDDALIVNLDAERIDRVLRPKVSGADHLDAATRGMALDYFVLFSSVTTLVGNPGQANYVAANGYLEGVARRRRAAGLAGLAIGWGPISDVGVVARNQRLAASLKQGGFTGMAARDALDLMAEALARPPHDPASAVITIAVQDWATAAERLPLLRSPAYAALVSHDGLGEGASRSRIDLRALVAEGDAEAARRKVVEVIVEEISRVLHLPSDDINLSRPLGEIGLDSLMGLELAMALQDRFGLDIPLSSSTGNLTVSVVADQIIAQVSTTSARSAAPAAYALAESHLGDELKDMDLEQAEAVRELVGSQTRSVKRLLN